MRSSSLGHFAVVSQVPVTSSVSLLPLASVKPTAMLLSQILFVLTSAAWVSVAAPKRQQARRVSLRILVCIMFSPCFGFCHQQQPGVALPNETTTANLTAA